MRQSSYFNFFDVPIVKNGQNAGVVSMYASYFGPIFRLSPGSSSNFIAKTIYVDATDANKRWPFNEFITYES